MAAVQALGFTPRQARFLMLVLERSGVCLPRQYRAFASIADAPVFRQADRRRLRDHGPGGTRPRRPPVPPAVQAVVPAAGRQEVGDTGQSARHLSRNIPSVVMPGQSVHARPAPQAARQIVVGDRINRRMAARLTRLLVALVLSLVAVCPSPAAAAVVRPPTSQGIAASPVPARGAAPANARSNFGARYYRAQVGRFTTVDPVSTLSENLVDPQRWNRYAYARNNPLKYVDPDGRELKWATSLSTSDRERLVKIVVDVVRREEGRAIVERLATDPQVVEIGARSVGDDPGSGVAKTLGVINLKGSDLAIAIDLGKISSIDPRQDPVHAGGTTTMAHELYHANSFISAPKDGTSRWLFVAAGDKPSSATGPAEKWAVGLFQAPKVIKKKEAEQLFTS